VKVNNRKVRKFKGGGADMGDPGKAGERAASGYGSTAGVDRSKVSPQQEASHQRSIASAKLQINKQLHKQLKQQLKTKTEVFYKTLVIKHNSLQLIY
jgi:hypothetical protein